MPFDHLLLPLLGGYWFISEFNLLRFRALGLSRYRLLFEAAFYGFLALCLSFAATRFLLFLSHYWADLGVVRKFWQQQVPFPYTGTAVGALLIGGLSPYVLNRFWERAKCSEKAIWRHGDLLLALLLDAQQRRRPVMLSLSSNKVYVGWVTLSSNLSPSTPCMMILPTLSGYRHADTQTVHFTTSYRSVYNGISKGLEQFKGLSAKDFQVVIPLRDIRTATPFSRNVGEEHFKPSLLGTASG